MNKYDYRIVFLSFFYIQFQKVLIESGNFNRLEGWFWGTREKSACNGLDMAIKAPKWGSKGLDIAQVGLQITKISYLQDVTILLDVTVLLKDG